MTSYVFKRKNGAIQHVLVWGGRTPPSDDQLLKLTACFEADEVEEASYDVADSFGELEDRYEILKQGTTFGWAVFRREEEGDVLCGIHRTREGAIGHAETEKANNPWPVVDVYIDRTTIED